MPHGRAVFAFPTWLFYFMASRFILAANLILHFRPSIPIPYFKLSSSIRLAKGTEYYFSLIYGYNSWIQRVPN